MRLNVDTALLDAARSLEPIIREHVDETESQRRPARPIMEALAEAGLFRMLTPRSLGGLEVDPVTCARVIEEVAGYDSAAGWALMTGNSVDWWAARLPDAGAEELYADGADVIIAAAFHPPMQAVAVDGGYRISGRSPLASNVHDSRWLFVNALVMDGDQPRMVGGAPDVISAIVHTAEARIIDTWHVLGMRGTDSNDVALDAVFVPERRTYRMSTEFVPGRHYQGPLYRFPAIGEVVVIGCPVQLAIARGAISELRDLAERKTPFGSSTGLRGRAIVQSRVARAEALLNSARLLVYDTLTEAWMRTRAGLPSSLEQKADLLLAGAHAVSSAVEAVELMYNSAGTSAIYTRSRLERHFRDIQVLKQHGFIAESRFETVGQVYLGVAPEFGLVGL